MVLVGLPMMGVNVSCGNVSFAVDVILKMQSTHRSETDDNRGLVEMTSQDEMVSVGFGQEGRFM